MLLKTRPCMLVQLGWWLLRGRDYPAFHQAELARVFQATNRLLRELGADYWLVFGTLLGHYRQGDFLRLDPDVDLGAHEKEYSAIWSARTRLPRGFRMHDTSRRHGGPKLYVTSPRGYKTDIYFYQDREGWLRCHLKSRFGGDVNPFPRDFVYPIRAARLAGEETCIPNQPEPYLRHMYGCIEPGAVQDPRTGYYHPRV